MAATKHQEADLDFGNVGTATGLREPTDASDAATRGWVEDVVSEIPSGQMPPVIDGGNF